MNKAIVNIGTHLILFITLLSSLIRLEQQCYTITRHPTVAEGVEYIVVSLTAIHNI